MSSRYFDSGGGVLRLRLGNRKALSPKLWQGPLSVLDQVFKTLSSSKLQKRNACGAFFYVFETLR